MAWKGGFNKVVDRDEFKKHVDDLKVPSWVRGITLHHTVAPWSEPPVSYLQRLKNLENYYKNEKRWSGGPHLYTWPKGIGLGTPLTYKTVHSVAFNSGYWSLEMEGYFDTDRSAFKSKEGQEVIDNAAFVFATLLKQANLPANNTTIKFHREDPKARKTCPGSAIDKNEFIQKVQSYLNGETPEMAKKDDNPPAADPEPTTYNIQARLNVWGADPLLVVDGDFGPKTEQALKSYQSRMGVASTGKLGPWIWKKLQEEPQVTTAPKPVEPLKKVEVSDANKLTGKDRPLYVKKVLMELGWTEFQAAAMVGNLMRESYPDLRSDVWGDWMLGKKIVPKGTKGAEATAFGIAQWRLGRLAHLKDFAKKMNRPLEDLDMQARFVDWELRVTEKTAGKMLKESTNLVEALRAGISYERPRGWTLAKPENGDGWIERMKFAQSLL